MPSPGEVSQTTLTILFNDYPAGALDENFNPDYTTATDPPNNPNPGANGTVFGLAMQTDDRPVIVGNFTAYNTTPRNRIARLNVNGDLDPSFAPGAGADDFINAVALTPAGQIVIGGGFTSFNGSSRRGVARLNSDGSLDATFNPGLGAAGTVWGLDVQLPNGQVVIGGDFTTVNGEVRQYVARLNPNGSVDETFIPAVPDDMINAVAVDSTGKVIIGGAFSTINGIRRRCIARLNVDGSLDNTFNPGTGVDGPVYAIKIQTDNKILIGGAFTEFDLRQRNSIARLNTDGSLDTTFNPGTGFDGPVYCLGLELSNGTNVFIYAGGLFSSYNDTRRLALARLFLTGELDTGFHGYRLQPICRFPDRPLHSRGRGAQLHLWNRHADGHECHCRRRVPPGRRRPQYRKHPARFDAARDDFYTRATPGGIATMSPDCWAAPRPDPAASGLSTTLTPLIRTTARSRSHWCAPMGTWARPAPTSPCPTPNPARASP